MNVEFDAHWKKIDEDGDGHLTMSELAKFFNFKIDEDGNAYMTEMTDEEILQVLAVGAAHARPASPPVQAPCVGLGAMACPLLSSASH